MARRDFKQQFPNKNEIQLCNLSMTSNSHMIKWLCELYLEEII